MLRRKKNEADYKGLHFLRLCLEWSPLYSSVFDRLRGGLKKLEKFDNIIHNNKK
jgi:hypothetical protein